MVEILLAVFAIDFNILLNIFLFAPNLFVCTLNTTIISWYFLSVF